MTMTIAVGTSLRKINAATLCLLVIFNFWEDAPSFFSGVTLTRKSSTSTVMNIMVESAYISGLIPFLTSL